MKELSIEEKAKRYDESLERAKKLKETVDSTAVVGWCEYIFNELRESEDERIRKDIIETINGIYHPNSKTREKLISWLEKQGEQNPIVIIPKFRVGDEIKTSNEESLTITKIDKKGYWSDDLFICGFDEECCWDLINEQKPAWSEEDISKLNKIATTIYEAGEVQSWWRQDRLIDKETANELNDWLKSLKERIQPQPYEWKQENTDALTDFENVMMHIGISFFGQHAGLDPNDTNAIKEQANILLGLVPTQWKPSKDTDDEKIRKALIKFHKSTVDIDGIKGGDIISWLEKQGEQKPAIEMETTEESLGISSKEYNEIINDCIYEESKSADKPEPRFKIGDWIIDTQDGAILHINKVLEHAYEVTNLKGGIYEASRCSIETCNRRWTIQDAKDGDVLVGNKEWNVILMFRGIGNTEWNDVIDYHCYYDCYRKDFIIQENLEYWGNIKNNHLKPATKEQRDLLFSKMKEAGYEWDAEKKELKEIHVIDEGKAEMDYCFTKMMNGEKVSSTWSDVDEADLNNIIWLCNNCIGECEHTWIPSQAIRIKSLIERIKNTIFLQPRQEWSEEDEEELDNIIDFLNSPSTAELCPTLRSNAIAWLKSLKDKVHPQWKPSEEQIQALEYQVHSTYKGSWQYKASNELLEQLKKLYYENLNKK